MTEILIYAGIALAALIIIGLIVTRLYVRSTKERAYVRTGFGGEKVITNGGALVFPVLHETVAVNMNTLRLTVQRRAAEALITLDKLRVDVQAEFYVRVRSDAQAIAIAAQTLGKRTLDPRMVSELVEGKFVDALRSVAAGLTMEQLHTNRTEFVQKVQQVSAVDLAMNGLELESVSLTGLDQTAREHFNENNAFDAEGLTILTRQIEQRKKERNEVTQETAVAIAEKNREANQKRLGIQRQDREAQLAQEQEIAVLEATQRATVAEEEAKRLEQAERARIGQEKAVEEAEIQRQKSVQTAEIDRDRAIKEAEIQRSKVVELAEQDKSIAVAQKSQAQSEAQAEADKARATAVEAREAVVTSERTAVAEREKRIAILAAEQEAERQATSIRVMAAADRSAAEDRAAARLEEARGEAEAIRIRAEADEVKYRVDAEGQEKLNLAENRLDPRILENRERLATLTALPAIVTASVKPMEKISNLSIVDVRGLTGQEFGEGGERLIAQGPENLGDSMVNAALRYRASAPLVDSVMAEIGMTGGSIAGLTQAADGKTFTSPARRKQKVDAE